MKSIHEQAVSILTADGYDLHYDEVKAIMNKLTESEIGTLLQCAARVAEKEGPSGFRLIDE